MQKSHTNKNRTQQQGIIVFAGLDPTGGAGIQADIETLASLQQHALPIVTCLTIQDTQNVTQVQSCQAELLKQQVAVIKNDISIAAIKIGLLSSVEIINLVSEVLQTTANIPVIFDPILKAGGGGKLSSENSIEEIILAMREKIMPYTTIITPNSLEACALTGTPSLQDAAAFLLQYGCKHVLLTGEHENNPTQITNRLYSAGESVSDATEYKWPRLPHQYHGSGCTLASALCAFLANGAPVSSAVQQAQAYTHQALKNAHKLGQHQYHPNRMQTYNNNAD